MGQQRQVYQWYGALGEAFAGLGEAAVFRLAAFSLGVALAGACTLRQVAEALPRVGKPDTEERRFQRFLADPKVGLQAGCEALAGWVLRRLATGGLLVLLVDETHLGDRLRVMAVSVVYHQRALPVAWWAYAPDAWPMGQVALILTLLRWVKRAAPPDVAVLVEADRGIGTSPELLRGIGQLGWAYLVRVQRQVRLRLDDGREVAFADLVTGPAQRWAGGVYAFKKAKWLRCWAVAQWPAGQREPWLLLTTWPKAQGNWYALRMWQEEAFRDFKSFGFQWQRSRVWQPAHANRLWLVLAVAYAWVVSLGPEVRDCPACTRELTRGTRRRYSVFRLGRSHLLRLLGTGQDPSYHLHFHPLPYLESVVI